MSNGADGLAEPFEAFGFSPNEGPMESMYNLEDIFRYSQAYS